MIHAIFYPAQPQQQQIMNFIPQQQQQPQINLGTIATAITGAPAAADVPAASNVTAAVDQGQEQQQINGQQQNDADEQRQQQMPAEMPTLNAWEMKVTAYEKNQKKLARNVKHRKIFEKTFIELKGMKEKKERNNRVGFGISSAHGANGISTLPTTSAQIQINDQNEAEMGEVGLEHQQKQQEIDEKVLQQAALIPPLLSNPPRRFFDNRNGLADNSLAQKQKQLEIVQKVWTDTEKAVFTEKIALYGKNFAAIAAFLPNKTVKECVQFYYMTKKRNKYKQTFGRRKKTVKRQGYRPPIMPRRFSQRQQMSAVGKATTAGISEAATKLATGGGPTAIRQKQQQMSSNKTKKENNNSNTADRNVPKSSSQKQQRPAAGTQLPSHRPNTEYRPPIMSRFGDTNANQMQKNQQVQQKVQQIVAAAAAPNRSMKTTNEGNHVYKQGKHNNHPAIKQGTHKRQQSAKGKNRMEEDEEGKLERLMEFKITEIIKGNSREETVRKKLKKANENKWMEGIELNEIEGAIGDWDKLSILKMVEMADQEIREHPEKLNLWLPWLECAIPKCGPQIDGFNVRFYDLIKLTSLLRKTM